MEFLMMAPRRIAIIPFHQEWSRILKNLILKLALSMTIH